MTSSLQQSLPIAFAITALGALTMVGGVTLLRAWNLTTPLVGRKLMHIATGPVFILTWMLYPGGELEFVSRGMASIVPLSVAVYMLFNSFGIFRNRALIQTVSRSGASSELRTGPFYYGVLHSFAAYYFWVHRATGVVALIILCVGDGVADLAGRAYGKTKWSHNKEKSVQGTAAFVLLSLPTLFFYTHLYQQQGLWKQIPAAAFQWQLPIVTIVAGLVESLPLGNFDNIAVFVSVILMGSLLGW